MNEDSLLADTRITLQELHTTLEQFDQDEINVVPFEGSWTAGELVQHLVISGSGFVELINGHIKDTTREPDLQAATIKKIFLDFTTKMKSPDFVVPPKMNYQKSELLASVENIRYGIEAAGKTLDLSKTCIGFELPVLGLLTRYECVCFVLYHTQRHIQQLKNIRDKLITPVNQP